MTLPKEEVVEKMNEYVNELFQDSMEHAAPILAMKADGS